ncbi:MAG: GatB/YqeY domain-containing protein [Candidatus Wallbacteria bacterium]|nr:GatB/YqeY domain-containing protein [Candidatus Wallbacteria bacterium]
MDLKTRLNEDMKTAMKAREELRLLVIRTLRSDIRKVEIDGRKDLDDTGVVECILRAIKQREDAAAGFEQGGRPEQAAKERTEIALLRTYLPAQLSTEEVAAIVEECVLESGAAGPKDMGKVMKLLMPRVKGKADGGKLQQLVKERLGAAS